MGSRELGRVVLPQDTGPARVVVELEPAFRAAYRIGPLLGHGTSGAVFQAEHRSTGRSVAVKLLAEPGNAESVARFTREARALALVAHPAILAAFDVGTTGGHPYLALQLAPGGSLRDLLERAKRLTPEACHELVGPCLEALALCHARGLVHRDLKLENLLVTDDGRVVLGDFGMVRSDGVSDLTQPGQLVGSPSTVSPEVIAGQPAGTAADVYACGVMLFELLTGRVPFPATSLAALLNAHTRTPPPLLRTFAPDLPVAVEQAVLRALAKDPEDRGDVRALVAALEAAATAKGAAARGAGASVLKTHVVPRRPPPRRPPGADRGTLAAVGCGVVLALLLAAAPARPPAARPPASAPPAVATPEAPAPRATPRAAALASPGGMRLGSGAFAERSVSALAWSPDGQRLATGTGAVDGAHCATVWDLSTGQPRVRIAHLDREGTHALGWSADGARVVGVSGAGLVWVADAPALSGAPAVSSPQRIGVLPDFPRSPWLEAAGFLPDGRAVAVEATVTGVRALVEGDAAPRTLPVPGGIVMPMVCRLDGAHGKLATSDGLGMLRVYDVARGVLERAVHALDPAGPWDYRATGELLAATHTGPGEEDRLEVKSLADGHTRWRWSGVGPGPSLRQVSVVDLADDGSLVVLGVNENGVTLRFVWRSLADGSEHASGGFEFGARRAVSASGERVALAYPAAPVRVVVRPHGGRATPPADLETSSERITALRFLPGDRLASAGQDLLLRLWDLKTGALARPPVRLGFAPDALDLEPGGARLVASSATTAAAVALTEVRSLPRKVAVPAARTLTATDPAIGAWSARGRLEDDVTAVASDGARVAAGGRDGELRVWALPR